MLQYLWLGFGCSVLFAVLGFASGWMLRGRMSSGPAHAARPRGLQKDLAEQALHGLNAAAESVRSCVEQHIECIKTIESELHEASGTEPAVISCAADSIIAANGLVQHQFRSIQELLDSNQQELQEYLTDPRGLLLTFASLDRQKHAYRQVLRSLEQLAAEIAEHVAHHGNILRKITTGLEDQGKENLSNVTGAVAEIFDAADEIQQKIESSEEQIGQQAEKVRMQAVLSHVDLLTSLPNRRAFEAELQQHEARARSKGAYCTIVFLDLDGFGGVNSQYGHKGGDLILKQAGSALKQLLRGKDLVARYHGDAYAVILHQTTLHDALPVAERMRTEIERTKFSRGISPLRVTASLGVAQLQPEESMAEAATRTDAALRAAREAGGNLCYWHDGKESHPVSAAFKSAQAEQSRESGSLLSMFKRSLAGDDSDRAVAAIEEAPEAPLLTGRSLFVANLQRRLAEWKRGGPAAAVILLHVDQSEQLIAKFGPPAKEFLHRVLGGLLEAVTRDMDERCEFDNGVYATLLPGLDQVSTLAVAERLQSQIRQSKLRFGDALWNITASIGVAHCTSGLTVVDVMQSAETAMLLAAERGGDTLCVGEAVGAAAEFTIS